MHPYGVTSLIPPLLAIVLAIATRRVIPSLLLAVFAGALILAGGNPIAAVALACEEILWKQFVNPDLLRVFAFTALMAAMIGVIHAAGGMAALVEQIGGWASNRRRGQLATWLLGLVVFFDDYANTLLIGNTMRPVTDRLRISREKLAYIVDCTAAPVAGIAILSTWVATEIQFIDQGLEQAGLAAAGLGGQVFLETIPYRFYPLLALSFVGLVAWLGRDFGPMLFAERRQLNEGNAKDTDANDTDANNADATSQESTRHDRPQYWYHAVAPVVVVLGVVVWLLRATSGDGSYFGGDSYLALLYGSLLGLLTAAGLALAGGSLSLGQVIPASAAGARIVIPALAILWLATCVRAVTDTPHRQAESEPKVATQDGVTWQTTVALKETFGGETVLTIKRDAEKTGQSSVFTLTAANREQLEQRRRRFPDTSSADDYDALAKQLADGASPWQGGLGAGVYLGELLGEAIPTVLLPTLVFVLAAFVAFATGTSWGTMGILTPLVVVVTARVLGAGGAAVDAHDPILLATVGSVLAGAIFGDHCSPISDTTVLSSAASDCDHIAHVWTQMPYAIVVGVVAILVGTLPAGFGIPIWGCSFCLIAGIVVLGGVLILWGRSPNEPVA